MSRRHSERLASSILGERDPFLRIPLVLQVGIDFGACRSVRDFMDDLLNKVGCTDAEDLRDLFDHPNGRLMARPAPEQFRPKQVHSEPVEVILRDALILGLATASIYDPARPLLWTNASLTRRLELYDPRNFYQ
jgi:hypothetical protein